MLVAKVAVKRKIGDSQHSAAALEDMVYERKPTNLFAGRPSFT